VGVEGGENVEWDVSYKCNKHLKLHLFERRSKQGYVTSSHVPAPDGVRKTGRQYSEVLKCSWCEDDGTIPSLRQCLNILFTGTVCLCRKDVDILGFGERQMGT
jgi:hypothetical protein